MSNATVQLEIFADFVCPWCYLASAVVERLQKQIPVQVTWSPFPLHPSTPVEGLALRELLRGVNLEASHQCLYALMDELKLEYSTQRTHTYNSRLAQELSLWAETQPGGFGLRPLLYRAYFVDNRNLAEPAVLLDLVNAAGLDPDSATHALDKRSFSAAVDASWDRARKLQITGVPTFISGDYQMTGYQPLSELLRFIDFIQTGTPA